MHQELTWHPRAWKNWLILTTSAACWGWLSWIYISHTNARFYEL